MTAPTDAQITEMRRLNIRLARQSSHAGLMAEMKRIAPDVERLRAVWPEGADHVRNAAIRLKREIGRSEAGV